MIDTGATSSVIDDVSLRIVRELRLPVESSGQYAAYVIMANSALEGVIGVANFPVELDGVKDWFPMLMVKNLKSGCILGMDFITHDGIIIDGDRGIWSVAEVGRPHLIAPAGAETNLVEIGNVSGLQLDTAEASQLRALLDQFVPIMPRKGGFANGRTHVIDVQGAEPIRQRACRRSPVVRGDLHAEVDRLLADGKISRSNSPWASPPVMVPKGPDKYRFCVDYRALDKVTRNDAYPLPRMDRILDSLRDARYISKIDLSEAFLQIKVEPSCCQYTAFVVEGKGLFEFIGMEFAMCYAPAISSLYGQEL